jgi:phosphocarrier protein FPr
MVGLVLVSHSRPLAGAVRDLVRSMTGPALPLAIAAGAGENHAELGTDAVEISEAILSVRGTDGVLVLMDIGSAILSSETALDLLEESVRPGIRFCSAPFVEGAIAAGVTANLGAPLDDVVREALASLRQKETALSKNSAPPPVEKAPAAAPPLKEKAAASVSAAPAGENLRRVRLTVRNAHGLHARPAARLITETRPFRAEITVRNLTNQRGPVSIRSLSSLSSLEILQNHEIEVAASGRDAALALERIAQLVKAGLGEAVPLSALAPPAAEAKPAPRPPGQAAVPVSEGIAVGPGFHFKGAAFEVPADAITDVAAEIRRLHAAFDETRAAMEARRERMGRSPAAAQAGIFEAQLLALEDPELIDAAVRHIEIDHDNAARAWSRANSQIVARYSSLQDPYLRERAADLLDVGHQVLEALGAKKSAALALAEPRIIIADDLTPSQVSNLDPRLALGVILLDGGPTAHSSILLRALGVPAVVQARAFFSPADLDGPGLVACDGTTGEIWFHPSAEELGRLRARQADERLRAEEEKKAAALPGATLDGQRVEILANAGQTADAVAALDSNADGIGLLRTEFLFLDRADAPAEDEQVAALAAIADPMQGRPVVVRTLDIGGDKPLPYAAAAPEQNPFLGVRAVRLCFAQPELFAVHLRAILRAGHGRDFRIMFPMIADTSDLVRARAALTQAHDDLAKAGVAHAWPVPTGIMIEIPSAALGAAALAEQADFFSIGTNDLTQYALAADRGNPALACYQDPLHPAVLRLIDSTVRGARLHHRPVAVCGEAAADEIAAPIFVGLGVRELSLSPAKMPRIKAALRQRKMNELEALAQEALECATAAEVRKLASS